MLALMNEEQRVYWNGPAGQRWVAQQAALDRTLHAFGRAALKLAAVQPGERVLDVGCGCGDSALELAEHVGTAGHVTGIDISDTMLARARERAQQTPQVSFSEADAALFRSPNGASFDLVFSRFGVMFFADPEAAFRNFRQLLAATGRLVFVCWRDFADNPWAGVPFESVRRVVPSAESLADGDAPGPYAFADERRLARIMSAAGFQQQDIQRFDTAVILGRDVEQAVDFALQVGPASRALQTAAPGAQAQAREELARALAAYAGPNGVELPGSAWLVRASLG
jgi:ubiquinone/menaquinone biosynthesis C-methylase UbiE